MDDNTKINTDNKIQSIKNKYFKIHKAIFKYGLFIITIIISLRKFISIANSEYTIKNIINDDLNIQKTKLINNFVQKLSQTQKNPDITGYITLGETKDDELAFQSYNNLISYKGFVIPKVFWISKTTPLQPLSYYESGQYSKEEMEVFLKNMIISTNKFSESSNKQMQLPITNTIAETFNIDCIFQNKIYSQICSFATKNFIDSFFIYNIDLDIQGFKSVFNKLIKEKEYKQSLCDNIINYSLYSKKTSDDIRQFIEYCGDKEIDIFQKYTYFLDVQQELENKYISSKTYNDNMINIYKLISFQQIVYSDLSYKRLNTDRINSYLSFLEEALKKDKITKFYKEEIYYFNNYYIQKALENPEITSKINEKSSINDLYKKINIINNGSTLIGFKGLVTEINPNLLITETSYVDDKQTEDYTKTLNLLLQQITDFDIKEKFFSGNNILLNGIMTIPNESAEQEDQKTKNIGLKLRLEEKERKLNIKQVEFIGYKDLTDIVNKLTQKETRSIVDLQKYIKQNSSLLSSDYSNQDSDTKVICDQIKASLTSQNIETCDKNKVIIDIIRRNKTATLSITHNNFILEKIDIDNPETKDILNKYLQKEEIRSQVESHGINSTNIAVFLSKLITELFNYKSDITNNQEGSTNTIIIIEKIKTYLGIIVNDIVEKNGKILIEFTVKDINFIGNYNSETSTIQAIYFKDVTTNNLPMLIKNLTMPLDDAHKKEIDQFTTNPLGYIKLVSPDSYLFYQKFISEGQIK